MMITAKTMEWLDQNRNRAYPMVRDKWRATVSPESRLDCVLLDALVFDSASEGSALVVKSIGVTPSATTVVLKYGDSEVDVRLSGGGVDGEESFDSRIVDLGDGTTASMVFSSHAYIRSVAKEVEADPECEVLPSRIVGAGVAGVDGLSTNGSDGVEGHDTPKVASGDVILEDGYRTSPTISNGKLVVRVGVGYGMDPCHHDFGEDGSSDCGSPLLFFCGQNGVNSGGVVISGGRGISVSQGRTYTVKQGSAAGRSVPCIEIVADRELLELYTPQA